MAEQPNTEPDEQLSLASCNRISITVAGSEQREGEPGGQRGSALSPCPPPAPCRAGIPSTQGCPLCHPGCARGVSCAGSQESPELAQSPVRGCHPCRGHPGVVQSGCCPVAGAPSQGILMQD